MEKLIIHGGHSLRGTVRVSSAKNAILPIIVATLLPVTPATIVDAPHLDDVSTICSVLESLGVKVTHGEGRITFDAVEVNKTEASYELMSRMRASFLVMGPLLAKMGHARIALPGGCMIGSRPIDLHLKAFEAMGAEIHVGNGYVEGWAPSGLKGNTIYLDFPSVGATENLMMAAALAEGTTILENPAEEPEIVDLANYLNQMGARVRGAGTDTIRIEGVKHMHGSEHTTIPDRIEAGTYMIAAAMTGGDVVIENVLPEHQKPLVAKLREAGVTVVEDIDSVHVSCNGPLKALEVKTMPYPGFPTDMQAQIMAMLTVAQGRSRITETVFENRFMHVVELNRMGGQITTEGRSAIIEGPAKLTGCQVRATDLRAGAAMVLAGLVAEGVTEVGDIFHIDRGYENLVQKLRSLGADITRANV